MADDKKNTESLDDFDFDKFLAEDGPQNTGNGPLDLDDSFNINSFDAGQALYDDSASTIEAMPFGQDEQFAGAPVTSATEVGEIDEKPKKKGLLGALFGGKGFAGKGKPKKEKTKKSSLPSEVAAIETDASTVPAAREKKTFAELLPRDLGGVICVVFSAFLFANLLFFNIAAWLSRGPDSTLMQTLCFVSALNIVGLVLVAVPILFYRFPKERTLPNVMLGISVGALFLGVMMAITDFYRYGFAVG